jgi:hypothetical protein
VRWIAIVARHRNFAEPQSGVNQCLAIFLQIL